MRLLNSSNNIFKSNSKNKSSIIQKINNISSSKEKNNVKRYKNIIFSKINKRNPINLKKKNSKEKKIKLNVFKISNIERNFNFVNNLTRNTTNNKTKSHNLHKDYINYSLTNKKLSNNSFQEKEFNKIILIEPRGTKNLKMQKKKNYFEKINNKSNQNIFHVCKNSAIKLNKKKPEKIIEAINIDLNLNMSKKFMEAQEKWKNNYFATIIQKIFRGFYFRKITLKNMFHKSKLNIYIKKKAKDKSSCNKSLKIKKLNIINIHKRRNYCSITTNKSMNDNYSQEDLINLCNENTIKRDNYSNKNYRIKEIIIKRKNIPILNLNYNNCYNQNPNYINSNNYNYNTMNDVNTIFTYRKKDDIKKYWDKINYAYKKRNMFNHWAEITNKNKIIGKILYNKKNYKNYNSFLKTDDTNTTTNSFSEEIKVIHFAKNSK